jgi:protein-tyrosine phosphatase
MRSYLRTQWARFFGLNLSLVAPQLFVGGQFRPEQWPAISSLGVRAVLSLQAEREDAFAGAPPERLLRLQVVDFTPPSLDQLDEGVRFVAECHAAGMPVLVHCFSGVGRAPLTAAAYLMARDGLAHHEALACVRAGRPIIRPNAAQVRSLREFERRLRGFAGAP